MGRGVGPLSMIRLDAPQQSKFLRRALKVAHVDHGHLGGLLIHLAAVAHFSLAQRAIHGVVIAISFLLHAGAGGQRIILQSLNAIVSLGCLRRLVEAQFAFLVDGLEGWTGGSRR